MKRKKVYFITVVIGFAICMVGVIFGSRLVFQRTCERRTTPWSDLGTADDDEYRILIDAYKIKNQSNETVMLLPRTDQQVNGDKGSGAQHGVREHIDYHVRSEPRALQSGHQGLVMYLRLKQIDTDKDKGQQCTKG